jgi:hypothetical protein
MPPPDYAPAVEGVPGVRRLPLSCRVGDWTHYEWIGNRLPKAQYPTPPPFIKVLPKPPGVPWNKWDGYKLMREPCVQGVDVWLFERFDYYQNDVLLHAYRRIQ